MEQSNTNLSDSKEDTVEGGCLPDWGVEELPAPPPYRFGGAFRSVMGPGIIALGGSIGSGEWLLGPAITAQYGGQLLWIATAAVLLQVFINLEAIRYTLYTGETMFVGYMRCKPGPRFWAFFYVGTDVGGIWPRHNWDVSILSLALTLNSGLAKSEQERYWRGWIPKQ